MESVAFDIAINQLAAAAAPSTLALRNRVARYKGRDRTLTSLYNVLENLYNNLKALEQTTISDTSPIITLEGPIHRCNLLCKEFERAMQEFEKKLTTDLKDWSKMEFMTGDINDFIDILTGYQATISVSLDTLNKSVQNH
jgi:methionine synthase II (cobalamin-independent)